MQARLKQDACLIEVSTMTSFTVFFLFLQENICCGYPQDVPHVFIGEMLLFSWRNKKNIKTLFEKKKKKKQKKKPYLELWRCYSNVSVQK